MGMFSWLNRSKGPRSTSAGPDGDGGKLSRADSKAVAVELGEWAAARRGVEVFVEPRTAVTETSVVLVAHDGEFTRRRIASPKAAQKFAHDNALPIYDATVVGYPQRMRYFSRKQTILLQRMEQDFLDG